MTARTKSAGKTGQKGKVKVGKLKVNKETVKNLSDSEKRGVKGGIGNIKPQFSRGGGLSFDRGPC